MPKNIFVALPLVVVLGVAACASTGGATAGRDSSSSRNAITTAQLDERSNQTAYQVVQRLKPTWLQRRGQQSFRGRTQLLVVVDEGRLSELGVLHSLRAGDLREIRYMDPRRATLKYGDQANGGAILVFTKS